MCCKTKKDLAEAVLSIWDEIAQEIINKTMISVTKRQAKLIVDNEGEWILDNLQKNNICKQLFIKSNYINKH